MSILTMQEVITLASGKFTTYKQQKFLAKDGQERAWEFIEKLDSVEVLPITPQGTIICIKSFRVPINDYVLESPAGLLDHSTDPLAVAQSELLEETGYSSDLWESVGTYPHAAGISNNFTHYFIARDVVKIAEQNLENTEDIQILEYTPDQIRSLAVSGHAHVETGLLALLALAKL